ncbi:DUF1080 domain-containing protein [Maribellus comscasis]|uniref:DUF1080 domain-containing protein n=1 Tax=Maribellus comscasis TaxID=2681766 RepID=A0A6I6K106_9BACT|nr:DUF1080 domain-containing protein [Maribellus comscasis]QGY46237.1 DUF1080 domain-containing protein [Maribellus comscasis]
MKKIILTIGIIFLFAIQTIAQTTNGFVPLFNGNNLNLWEVKAKPEDIKQNFWKVENNVIVVNSTGNKNHDYVWLMTKKEYENFELKLKFAAYQSSSGNSGIQIRSRYDEKDFWLDGPQIDIHPPLPWRTGFMWDETRGVQRWIYPDIPKGEWVNEEMRKKEAPMKYSDQKETWNNLRIVANGNSVKAWLNGVLITNFDSAEILNDEFHKNREVGKKGNICLQLHTGDELFMKFKDIFIKEL